MKLTKIEPPKIISSPKYSVNIIELFKNLGNVIVFFYYISSVKTFVGVTTCLEVKEKFIEYCKPTFIKHA